MKQTKRMRVTPSWGTIFVALLVGVLAFLLLFPASGVDSDPPVCRAMLFYPVSCEDWVAPLVAGTSAAIVGVVLWRTIDRRRGGRRDG